MSEGVRVLTLAGSLRTGSFNKQLARLAADLARDAGAVATWVDLSDFALPLYDGDLEEREGLPAGARALKAQFLANEAILIASPEYNASIPGVLKNAIDWVSRAETDEEPPLAAIDGKVFAIVSASPGALGGLRGLYVLRNILLDHGGVVVPQQLSVPRAHEAFDEAGRLKDPRRQAALTGIVERMIDLAARLRS